MGRFDRDGRERRREVLRPGAHPRRRSLAHNQGQSPAGAGIAVHRLMAHRLVPLRPEGRRCDWWTGRQLLPFG
jgi:hypothetical protein